MKAIVQGFCVMAVILVLFVSFSYIESHYTRKAIVTDINAEAGEVEFTDNTDNIWIWCDNTADFTIGDSYKLKMHSNYTDNTITDDIILKVQSVD